MLRIVYFYENALHIESGGDAKRHVLYFTINLFFVTARLDRPPINLVKAHAVGPIRNGYIFFSVNSLVF